MVHFPLALLFAAFGFDVACLLLRRQPWLDRAAAALYLLGALGAGAAFLSGRQAEDGLRQVPPAVQPHIAAHADMAQWTLMTFVAIAVVRAVVGWLELGRRETRRSLVRLLLLTSAATGLGLLVETADRGGALVYRHGVAVAAMLPAEPAKEIEGGTPPRPPASFESRLTRGENGVLLWTPAPEDDEALETILRPAEGTAEWVVTPAPGEANPRGLGLRVSGHALLLLPGEFDDAQVEARLELAEFRGSVGVAHHALGMMKLESFQMDTDGRASLVHLEAGKKQVLDEGPVKVPQGPVALSVSAAGSHLKGMVDGEVVAHGHRGGEAPGGVGLLLDGSGVVRVLEMRVTPLSADH